MLYALFQFIQWWKSLLPIILYRKFHKSVSQWANHVNAIWLHSLCSNLCFKSRIFFQSSCLRFKRWLRNLEQNMKVMLTTDLVFLITTENHYCKTVLRNYRVNLWIVRFLDKSTNWCNGWKALLLTFDHVYWAVIFVKKV